MNISGNSRDYSSTRVKAGKELSVNLNFYSKPPKFELTLDEFEEFALARLKVLRKIEELRTRKMVGEAFNLSLDKTIQENLSPGGGSGGTTKSTMNNPKHKLDLASHFILRAAYCKTEDFRRWFIAQETFLFKYQFEKLAGYHNPESTSTANLKAFLHQNDLKFDMVPQEEKSSLISNLISVPFEGCESGGKFPSANEVLSSIYYKIPFQDASDLVAKRQCYIKAGYAYVPMRRIVTIITAKFRTNLSRSMVHASLVFSDIVSEYAPVAPLLNNMNSQYMGKDFSEDSHGIQGDYVLKSDNVDHYHPSMPLCMSALHIGLKQDRKLKHHGRLQYGLFLKGAGMSMEDATIFFQNFFTKIMTAEKFQKDYSYNIRHMYGKEGKRTNYTPYSCTKIILGPNPSSGDHHGCPYRHYSEDRLASLLSKLKIGNAGEMQEIISLKKGRHHNAACQKHFNVVHPNSGRIENLNLTGVGEHPNAWYTASVAYRTAIESEGVDRQSHPH